MLDKKCEECTALKESRVSKIEISEKSIKNLIYVIRGKQVMLDSDLATLYMVETGALNRAVKRNRKRFPEDFCFQLTSQEYEDLKCQIGISSSEEVGHGGRRTKPYAFTEQGISMLAAVLHSDVAIAVSIGIMRVFFDGQIYDAFSLMAKFVAKAEKKILLIDNYVDISTLNILAKKKKGVEVCIYTVKKTKLSFTDVENFNKQYPKLEVKYIDSFHDRFLIIDETYAYHIGASLKDAGKKCFAINLINDMKIVEDIIKRLPTENL